ncbi:hypothetical protein AAG570_004762 [Ranatra chinensis]|uniref:Major facilitator superfamily (MFS) profile domain-containing protein n=1 Tax=Ranatra chinensis TaxID=642074 RepID=A0ABD0Y1S5_9HEMI
MCGSSYVWLTPLMPSLLGADSEVPMTEEELSWAVSIVEVGCLVTPIPAAMLADLVGRKPVLLASGPSYLIAWLIVMFTRSVTALYVARLIQGMALGITYTVLPIFLGEIASPKRRGQLLVFVQYSWYIGIIFEYAIGPFLLYDQVIWASLSITIVFVLVFVWFPESAYYLAIRGREEEAATSLAWYKGRKDIEDEMTELKREIEDSRVSKGGRGTDEVVNRRSGKLQVTPGEDVTTCKDMEIIVRDEPKSVEGDVAGGFDTGTCLTNRTVSNAESVQIRVTEDAEVAGNEQRSPDNVSAKKSSSEVVATDVISAKGMSDTCGSVDDSGCSKRGWEELLGTRKGWKGLGLGLTVLVNVLMGGLVTMLSYASLVFSAGSQVLCSLIIGVLLLLTVPLFGRLMDTFGRRPVYLISSGVGFLTILLVGFYRLFLPPYIPEWVCDVLVVLYLLSIAGGVEALFPLLQSELFSGSARAVGSSVMILAASVLSFVSLEGFYYLNVYLGFYSNFFVFAFFCLFGFLVIYIYLPETKGKTFEEIQNSL